MILTIPLIVLMLPQKWLMSLKTYHGDSRPARYFRRETSRSYAMHRQSCGDLPAQRGVGVEASLGDAGIRGDGDVKHFVGLSR
jgi:hypothetical protein